MGNQIDAISLKNVYNNVNDFMIGFGTGNTSISKKIKRLPIFGDNNFPFVGQNSGSIWGYASSNSQSTAATNL